MGKYIKEKLSKIIGIAVLIILIAIAVFIYFFYFQKSSSVEKAFIKNPQKVLIESKGLAEFNAENDTSNDATSQDKKLAEEMTPIFKGMGDGKDIAKNKETTLAIGKIISKYPEYSDAYFLRASVSILTGDKDYQKIISDVDNAIKFHSSTKYKSAYDSTAGMYGMRAKLDILSNNYQQAVNDLEIAVKTDPSNIGNVFNTGGVKPEDNSDPTALQKNDLDLLIAQYPDDFRVYMFRGLFYNAFSFYDTQYYKPALADLEKAISINPNSALADYFLGTIYQKAATLVYSFKLDGGTTAYDNARDSMNKQALESFNQAIKNDPKFKEAYAQVAESFYSLEQYSEAIPYYDKVIELNPENAGAYNDRGLAKSYTNDYYGAISDFTQAANVKKEKSDSFLDTTYKNRADVYVKVDNLQSAFEDYSRAIGLLFGAATISMPISQIRSIYPEFNDISDQNLIEELRQKYYPNLSYEDFAKLLLSENKENPGSTVLADLYISRGDLLLKEGNFKKATIEYTRAPKENHYYADILTSERWKQISKTSDTEYYLDIQTLDFTQTNIVSLWVKILNTNTQNYSQQNYQIDCSGKKIKSVSATNYNSIGNVIYTSPAQDWQSVVPESIGEVLSNGMCK